MTGHCHNNKKTKLVWTVSKLDNYTDYNKQSFGYGWKLNFVSFHRKLFTLSTFYMPTEKLVFQMKTCVYDHITFTCIWAEAGSYTLASSDFSLPSHFIHFYVTTRGYMVQRQAQIHTWIIRFRLLRCQIITVLVNQTSLDKMIILCLPAFERNTWYNILASSDFSFVWHYFFFRITLQQRRYDATAKLRYTLGFSATDCYRLSTKNNMY